MTYSEQLFKTGIFCISFDHELAWGSHDRYADPRQMPLYWRMPEVPGLITELLKPMVANRISGTWGVVGIMASDPAKLDVQSLIREYGNYRPRALCREMWLHSAMFEPSERQCWYCPENVRCLASAGQEIACHTYTHVVMNDAATTRQVSEQELAMNCRVISEYGQSAKSMIFPRNEAGYFDLLSSMGILCFRGYPQRVEHNVNS